MKFDTVYYEPDSLPYPLGQKLKDDFGDLPWIPIQGHSSIKEVQEKPDAEFGHMKRNLIIDIRKTRKYVENHKMSNYLVPCISSGCTAMCLYYYLVCNYNKYTYLHLFVNRKQMLDRTLRRARTSEQPLTFEIGSNSDLVLENTITGNLQYTISRFVLESAGKLTFPTKLHMVDPIPDLDHREKVISRVSVSPQSVISRIGLGTSNLAQCIEVVDRMCDHGCPCGLLIAPTILTENWRELYTGLLEELEAGLTERMKKQMFLEVILITYSYAHRAIDNEAFPNAPDLHDNGMMTGRGRDRHCYHNKARADAELFLRAEINRILDPVPILYISWRESGDCRGRPDQPPMGKAVLNCHKMLT